MNAFRLVHLPPQSCQLGRSFRRTSVQRWQEDMGSSRSIATTRWIAFWYSILSIQRAKLDHSLPLLFMYVAISALKRSITSIDVSYETTKLVVSHLGKRYINSYEEYIESPTYIDLLRRRLCTSFVLANKEFGAMTSWPSTRRKVVANNPNSFTNSTFRSS